ncbi:hypothetical protein KRM28CT15_62620 [Krasilnikovia sp. M28-CT-15]
MTRPLFAAIAAVLAGISTATFAGPAHADKVRDQRRGHRRGIVGGCVSHNGPAERQPINRRRHASGRLFTICYEERGGLRDTVKGSSSLLFGGAATLAILGGLAAFLILRQRRNRSN